MLGASKIKSINFSKPLAGQVSALTTLKLKIKTK
jgi:hypothetical protein